MLFFGIIGIIFFNILPLIYHEYLFFGIIFSISLLSIFLSREKNPIKSIEITDEELIVNKSKKTETHFKLNEIKKIEYFTGTKRFGAMTDRGSESINIVFTNGIHITLNQIKYSNYYELKQVILSHYQLNKMRMNGDLL